MYEIQKFDQPPAEIIKDLAPGLQFDAHGVPMSPLWGDGGADGQPNMNMFGEGGMPPDLDKCVLM